MFHIKKRHLSFLVSETVLQVAQLSNRGNAFVRFFETPMPAGIIAGGEVKNIEAFTQFLLAVKKQAKITDKFVGVGIPETKATTHSLDLPNLNENEIEQAILREAPAFLPFSIAEEYIDWKIINKESDEQKVLISAVPKTVIDGFTKAFVGAGLSPVAFETTSLSLFRLIRHLPSGGRELMLAAEVSDASTVLILVKDQSVEVSSVISDTSNLVDKLQRVIQFFVERKTEGKVPETLYLSGKHAPQLATQIGTTLGIKTQPLKGALPKYPEAKQIEYALLYSLAYKTIAAPIDQKTINIMPSDLMHDYEENEKARFEKMLKILFLVTIGVFGAVTFFMYQTLDRAKLTIARRAVSVGTAATTPGELAFSPVRIALLGTLAQQNDGVVTMIETIYESVPEGITVKDITYEKDKAEAIIVGTASTRDRIIEFQTALEETTLFQKVTVPLSSFEQDLNIDYRIVLTLKKIPVVTPVKAIK